MSSVIKVSPDKTGRIIIRLYGQDCDVTNLVDESGKGSFTKFGEKYSFEVISKTKKRIQQALTDEKTEEAVNEG